MNTQQVKTDIGTVKLENVRLSYPHLFEPNQYGDESEPAYKATFIFDKKTNAGTLKLIQATMQQLVSDSKVKSLAAYKLCLRDGAEKTNDGYGEGVMFMSTKNKKRVPVVDRDKTPLDASSGKPYAGCYVNALVRFWVQDNKFGKRINCQLKAVQFLRDGEPFGDAGVDANEVFQDATDGSDDGIL